MGSGWDSTQLEASFKNAGYDMSAGGFEQSMYDHFDRYGKFEGVNPSEYFDSAAYIYAKAVDFYAEANNVLPAAVVVTEQMLKSMYNAIGAAGMSPWDHYATYGAGEGLNPSTNFDSAAYITNKTAQVNAAEQDGRSDWTEAEVLKAILDNNLTPLTHYFEYGQYEEGVTFKPGPFTGGTGTTQNLTQFRDSLYGTNGDDQFNAIVAGDLNDGDYIDGAGGFDTVYATMGKANAASEPTMINVEKLVLHAQSTTEDGGSNAVAGNVHFDAGKILGKVDSDFYSKAYGSSQGLQYLYNDDSRATLIVEDVRSYSTDMHIGWLEADPTAYDNNGNPTLNYEVYFHSQYLMPQGASSTGILNIELMDVKNSQEDKIHSLEQNVYDTMIFTINGTEYRLTAAEGFRGQGATIQTLLEAMETALSANPALDALIDLSLQQETYTGRGGSTSLGFYEYNNGHRIVVTANTKDIQFNGWVSSSNQPTDPEGVIAWAFNKGGSEVCPLIQTNIHLDNVGTVQWTDLYANCLPDEEIFGSASGDMIVGAYDNRAGIERFDVVVDQGSWLSSLASTNNTLRMVTVKAGDVNQDGHIGNIEKYANNDKTGELFIGKSLEANSQETAHWTVKPALLSTDGLTDVKIFSAVVDNVTYDGNLNIGAKFTNEGYQKYLHDHDNDLLVPGGLGTQYTGAAPGGGFDYTLGSANDILNMQLHGGMVADNDFVMNIKAGDGNDLVNISWNNQNAAGDDIAMTFQQVIDSAKLRNVTIEAGDGDDTVWTWGSLKPTDATTGDKATAGAVTVNGGEGNDAIYVGQFQDGSVITGTVLEHNAVWAFNVDPDHRMIDYTPAGAQAHDNNFLAVNDATTLAGSAAAHSGFGVYVTVNFMGFTSEVRLDGYTVATNGSLANLKTVDINNAIIKAIESDPTLSKLLIAKDGAGYGLIVESMIDGAMSTTDLGISFRTWNGIDGTGSVSANLRDVDGDYATQMASHDGVAQVPFDPATPLTSTNTAAVGDAFTATFGAVLLASLDTVGEEVVFTVDNVEYKATIAAGGGTADNAALDALLAAAVATDGTLLTDVWALGAAAGTGAVVFTRADVSQNVNGTFTTPPVITAKDAADPLVNVGTGTVVDGTTDSFSANISTLTVTPAGEWFGIEIEGVSYYAQQAANGSTQLTIAQLLAAARVNGNGALLTDDWALTGPDTAKVFTRVDPLDNDTAGGWTPGAQTDNSADLLGAPAQNNGVDATGTDEGTYSVNRVDGGLGDDVIVLNVGSLIDTINGVDHYINDTLVLSGDFGNDHVVNFDTGIDKVEFNVGARGFITGGNGGTTAALNNTTITTIEAAIAASATAAASQKSVGYMQVNGSANEYVFFQIDNNSTAGVVESEVHVLGTITLAAGEVFNVGDMLNIAPA